MASIISAARMKEESPKSNLKLSGAWTEREHEAFKQGVLHIGWSNWKSIHERYVPTRTQNQVSLFKS